MTGVIDKVVIINWALTDIGAFATFSVDGDDDLSGQIQRTWQRCVDHCFGLADWKFCKQTFKLTRTGRQPVNGWPHEFALPGGRIGDPLKVMTDPRSRQPCRNFDLEGDFLYAEAMDIWVTIKVERDPEHWDPAFRTAFTAALAGYLAVPVTQNTNLRDEQFKLAFGTPSKEGTGGMFGRLMAQNKAAAPIGQPLSDQNPLTLAGSGPWHGRF
ncbi:hypothetical protein H1W37_19475 [Stappia taiwanensis]|uniref:Uncharacterized protein n=1 Tax=Stappia taiwanensis TaxID=992267 RepID=A0A838Y3U7_9HYPH|nr:hypothetical protein [Stappia taiwanensis]MBA4613844.1 hypothetical protein [Stappia taiwanensis]GGE79099.1 hypothetical protein GCM10007285_03640 [Stappia taiwanensis]